MKLLKVILSTLLLALCNIAYATPTIVYNDSVELLSIGGNVEILEDVKSVYTIQDVIKSNAFKPSIQTVPNLGVGESAFWVKFSVSNHTSENKLLLELAQPTIDRVTLYTMLPNGQIKAVTEGEFKDFYKRKYHHQNYLFDLDIPSGNTATFYLRVNSGEQVMLPLYVGKSTEILQSIMIKDLIFGVFFGLLLVMLLYNLFIYFTVRDSIYLFYVFYILVTILNQGALQGYTFRFLWPNHPGFAMGSVYLFPALAGAAAMLFAKRFLNTKEYVPKMDKVLMFLVGVFVVAILLVFVKMYKQSFGIMQLNTMVGSIFVFILSIAVYRKGNRSAKFFLLAWTSLLIGATIFVLKDFGVLPYTNFTAATLEIGSSLELVLLSFALADKINTFRKEKEESQAQAMAALEENTRITREQNVILETKVNERTLELRQSNDELSKTLTDLKEAESQLVESEKMASLGQLTAGIAHEINNPINFVTSNVKPLRRDVDMIIDMLASVEEISLSDISVEEKREKISDLKEEYDYDYLKTEIDYLLKGINEGSSRTAEIVKGLRVFSRLDEDDLKKANINEGIDSTLIIVNNLLEKTKVEKNYGNLPMVECYPGKLNQVFLNMITNSLHAINSRYGEAGGGVLTLSTTHDENFVNISLKDNGIGMDENTQKKIFEPFFTTKDVGEGTGLGMSIAYNTINKHNGNIELKSELGVGTEFIIHIPIIHESVETT